MNMCCRNIRICFGKSYTHPQISATRLIVRKYSKALFHQYSLMGKKIGTHNGKFHADEVMGCFMLRTLPKYRDAEIIRTRDVKILDQCDIVIDVGAVYDHSRCRYDHHQRDFNETMESLTGLNENIKLSSAGLVYAHYGKEVIKQTSPKQLTDGELETVFNTLYRNLIKEVDAIDNGIDPCDHKLKYISNTDYASRVRRLNPNAFSTDLKEDEQFKKALNVAKEDFMGILEDIVCSWLPARKYVEEAFTHRDLVDTSGRILFFTKPGIPWVKHAKQIEEEMKVNPSILFAVFPDSTNGWRVQAVPLSEGFELRAQVLPHCVGLRDEELALRCNIPDAIFVHSSGFIGGAKTREGALKMAQLSVQM